MGNPPVPTALKVLRGNPGHRTINKKEPKPQKVESWHECPKWFSKLDNAKELKEVWQYLTAELTKVNVLTFSDLIALEMLCMTYASWRKRAIKAQVDWSKDGEPVVNPNIKIELDYSRQLRILLCEFGLTPSSRSKIVVTGDSKLDPLKKFLQ